MSESIRVRAIRNGFIAAQLKVAGSEFTLLKPELFSKTWMQKIEPDPAAEQENESLEAESSEESTARRRRRTQ